MKKNNYAGYLLIAPAITLLSLLLVYPFMSTLIKSFFNYEIIMMGDPEFIGFQNYRDAFSDVLFVDSLVWTMQFTIITVILSILIALGLALIMRKKFKGQSFVRVVILMPWAIPAIIAGIVWSDIFGFNGFVNSTLTTLNIINERITFFNSTELSKAAIIIADVWKSTPYSSLLILAGLLGISKEYYEAARVDGASKIQIFTHITLPLLKPTLAVVVMLRLISAFRAYGLVLSLTGGGPGSTTETIGMYAVKTFFTFGRTSYGAAISIVMMVISLMFSLFFLGSLRKRSEV